MGKITVLTRKYKRDQNMMLLPLQLHGPQLIEIELFTVVEWIPYGSILAFEKAVMAMKTIS